jgi:hypothetical protein
MRKFEQWRDSRIRHVSDRHLKLSQAATIASQQLRESPESEEAWGRLSRFYHQEAGLSAAFDFLICARASSWLEKDSTPLEVFQAWRARQC